MMTLRYSLTLLTATLIGACAQDAAEPISMAEPAPAASYERGPHNGRMLRDGDLAIELAVSRPTAKSNHRGCLGDKFTHQIWRYFDDSGRFFYLCARIPKKGSCLGKIDLHTNLAENPHGGLMDLCNVFLSERPVLAPGQTFSYLHPFFSLLNVCKKLMVSPPLSSGLVPSTVATSGWALSARVV